MLYINRVYKFINKIKNRISKFDVGTKFIIDGYELETSRVIQYDKSIAKFAMSKSKYVKSIGGYYIYEKVK